MSPSIAHVQACQPETMTAYGAALLLTNQTFGEQIRTMGRTVDNAVGSWTGEASAAASQRALADTLTHNHVHTAVETIAEHHIDYGAQLLAVKAALQAALDSDAKGMTVTDAVRRLVAGTVAPAAQCGHQP